MKQKVNMFTPPKTNMSPKNRGLDDVFPIETVPFLGDMLVFRGVVSMISPDLGRPKCRYIFQFYGAMKGMIRYDGILLMVQKSCVHQLRER